MRELLRQRVDPGGVETETIERPGIEALGCLDVAGIRGGDRLAPFADERSGTLEGVGDRVVRQQRNSCGGGRRLELDFCTQAHPVFLSAAAMPAIERSSG